MMLKDIEISEEKIEDFCRRWKITEFALFGSILRSDFTPTSDIDVLVSFHPKSRWSLWDMVEMQDELEELFGRKVDLVEKQSVLQSENYIRRKHILGQTEPIYVER